MYSYFSVCCVSVVHNGCVFWVRLWSFVYRKKMMTRALCFCLWAQLLSSHITMWVEITNTIACWSGAVGAIQCVCQLEEKERENITNSIKNCNSNRYTSYNLTTFRFTASNDSYARACAPAQLYTNHLNAYTRQRHNTDKCRKKGIARAYNKQKWISNWNKYDEESLTYETIILKKRSHSDTHNEQQL